VIGAVVNGSDLVELLWTSFAAGLGVTVVYGLAIFGGSRALDLGRDGHVALAAVYGALAVVAMAAVLGAIVLGVIAIKG
jgi:hypothetical protein